MKFYSPFYNNNTMKINTDWLHVSNKSIYEVSKSTNQWHGKWA